jgi:hypothetical protein
MVLTVENAAQYVLELARDRVPGVDQLLLLRLFATVEELFAGRHPYSQRCDTPYHNLIHAHEVAITTARLLDGHIQGRGRPLISAREFQLAIAASLLHDSGYLKLPGDDHGTGAKYLKSHVRRSVAVCQDVLPKLGLSLADIQTVQRSIEWAGAELLPPDAEQPANALDRFLASVLGTADLFGQLAAPDYPDRLAALYREFAEAGVSEFHDVGDLLRQSRSFYERQVRVRLDGPWRGVYRELSRHFADGQNHYLIAIQRNLARIDDRLKQHIDSRR